MAAENIFQSYLQPVKSVAEYGADMDKAESNKLVLAAARLKNQMDQQSVADDQAIRRAYQNSGGDPKAYRNALAQAGNYKAVQAVDAQELEKSKTIAETGLKSAQTSKTQQDALGAALDHYKFVLGTLSDPQQAANSVRAAWSDPILGPLMQRAGTADQVISQIPADQQGFAQWKATNAIGMEKLANMVKVNNVNLGGTMQTQAVQPATGQVSVVSSAPITQSADNAATQATSRANNAAQVGATIRGQNMTDARTREATAATVGKPFEVTGPDGQPILVQQDRAGNITPVQGYAPKSPVLKPIPATVNTAIVKNAQASSQIDRALTLLDGKSTDGMQGDTEATGWKGYLPNGVLNRLDPSGVDVRAIVSDIGSLKIHDRSGAAVTVSESPRLMPFIPLSTDDAATVKKKLNKLRVELAGESTAMQDIYSKEQGYRPSPVKTSSTRDLHSEADAILNGGK